MPCEAHNRSGGTCLLLATSWCHACERALCTEHGHCENCSTPPAAGANTGVDALGIVNLVRELRGRGWPGARTAYQWTLHRPLLHPRSLRLEPRAAIRYWPVGAYAWAESCAGGYGEHELISLGVRTLDTVVSQLGRVTRADDEEIFAGHAPMARLVAEEEVMPRIAAALRTFLAAA